MDTTLFSWVFPFVFGLILAVLLTIFSLYFAWFRVWCPWLPPLTPPTATQGPPDQSDSEFEMNDLTEDDRVGREAAGDDNCWPAPFFGVALRRTLSRGGRNDWSPSQIEAAKELEELEELRR